MRDIDMYNVRKKDGTVVNEAAGINSDGSRNVSLTGSIVKDKIYGSSNITKNYEAPMRGFEIVNDGVANLTYTINGMTFDVKAGEVDYNSFDPFTSVTITATSAYRARVFG